MIQAMREIAVFSGSAHRELAGAICSHLGIALSPSRLIRFANDCLEVQLRANCRERDVFVVQPLVPPVQENLMELLLMADAARGASAGRVTVVLPHYAYARSDKKDAPRISIAARLVADLLVTSGADRVLAVALHSPQVPGFFAVPVDHLHALFELAGHFRAVGLDNAVVMAPDLGYVKEAARLSRLLGVPVAAAAKQRISNEEVEIGSLIGEVRGKDVLIVDDEIARGTTVLKLLDQLADYDVGSVRVACTHGLFTEGALKRIGGREEVREIVCTDTVPLCERHSKLTVLSVARPLAEAIRRIHNGESVSVLFNER